jgi:uncharacterized delta-60 repeat protein
MFFFFCKSLPAQQADLDPSFGDGGLTMLSVGDFVKIIDLAVLPDKKIILALDNGQVWRFNANGQPDAAFGENGRIELAIEDSFLEDLSLSRNHKILLTGKISFENSSDLLLIRLNADGTFDPTFGDNGVVIYGYRPNTFEQGHVVIEQPDGKILVGGSIQNVHLYEPDAFPALLMRFEAHGTPDPSFGEDGVALPEFDRSGSGVRDLKLQADGKIVMCGTTVTFTPPDTYTPYAAVMRCMPNGEIDPDFGTDGFTKLDLALPNDSLFQAGMDQEFLKIALQSDGKIVALGQKFYVTRQAILSWLDNITYDTYEMVMARFQPDGAVDTSFGTHGLLEGPVNVSRPAPLSMAVDGHDTLYVGHYSDATTDQPGDLPDLAISKYLPDGTTDAAFGQEGTIRIYQDGRESISHIRLLPDGILFAGYRQTNPGAERQLLLGKLRAGDIVLPVVEKSNHIVALRSYPNPFSREIHLDIQLVDSSPVEAQLFNLQGQKLFHHSFGHLPAGQHEKTLRLEEALPRGPYLIELRAGQQREYRLLFCMGRGRG